MRTFIEQSPAGRHHAASAVPATVSGGCCWTGAPAGLATAADPSVQFLDAKPQLAARRVLLVRNCANA